MKKLTLAALAVLALATGVLTTPAHALTAFQADQGTTQGGAQ